jgi:hypothetical protein
MLDYVLHPLGLALIGLLIVVIIHHCISSSS